MSPIINLTLPLSHLSPREAGAFVETRLQRLGQSLDEIEVCLAALEAACCSGPNKLNFKAPAEKLDELQRDVSREVKWLVEILGEK